MALSNADDCDIVYVVKNTSKNEELRYSLRSLEENWQNRGKVWFYGGRPTGIVPDGWARFAQREGTKWKNVRKMVLHACDDDYLTEDIWLFNDDFFILRPVDGNKDYVQYDGTLYDRIIELDSRLIGRSLYSTQLKHLVKTLSDAGCECLNYAVHVPIKINRKKMKEVLERFPDEPMLRALYGNYWKIGGVNKPDVKVRGEDSAAMEDIVQNSDFVSTEDDIFKHGEIGQYLRDRFTTPSVFEVG